MEQGQYDLCIDDDKQVTRLTSDEWPSIEAGTTIVLRVIFKEKTYSTVEYKCRFCGAVNHISAKYSLRRQASCSIDW
jgi:predicted restriction endonuclease